MRANDRKPATKQSSYWMIFAVLAAVALLVTLTKPFDRLRAAATEHEAVGTQLLKLEVEPLTGASRSLSLEDLSGRVTLVNLWGPWCQYCLLEFPHLVDLDKKYGRRDDFQLLAVSYAAQGNDLDALRADTQAYLKRIGADLPTYADPTHTTHMAVAMTTGVQGFPTTVLLDKQGTIRAVWEGYRRGSEAEMDRLIAALLAE